MNLANSVHKIMVHTVATGHLCSRGPGPGSPGWGSRWDSGTTAWGSSADLSAGLQVGPPGHGAAAAGRS